MSTSPTDRGHICAAIERLAHEPGYVYSYAWIIRHDLFHDPAEAADINWREHLSFQELTLLGGLMVKAPISLELPGERTLGARIDRTYELFEALHESYVGEIIGPLVASAASGPQVQDDCGELAANPLRSASAMVEAIFYSGSGAYDFQYLGFAPARYQEDADWLQEHVGFDMSTAAAMARALGERPDAFRGSNPVSLVDGAESLLDSLCFREEALGQFDAPAVNAFLQRFSLAPGAANGTLTRPGEYNELLSHPLIRLGDGRYLLPIPFNLTQSLYESPTFWMRADAGYRDTAAKHRGDGTEAIVSELLGSVFGDENVFRNVKLFKGRQLVTDVDVLVVLGHKAIIAQCKSKSLTMLARSGDTTSLESDFRGAVQHAYNQGVVCRDAMRDAGSVRAEVDGQAVVLPPVDDAWIMCVLSDHYPALTHQTYTYLVVEDGQPHPIALSIFDLDALAFYLSDPFAFMYYVKQRVEQATYFRADEELSLLGYHIKRRLVRTPGFDREMVDPGFAQLIDANFPVARGRYPHSPAAERLYSEWKNPDFDELVANIQAAGEPGFLDAAFLLFDLSSMAADQLIAGMRATRTKTERDGRLHSVTVMGDGFGISFVSVGGDIERQAFAFGAARKYVAKTDVWLSLGGAPGSQRLVEFAAFSKERWREDADLERLARVTLKPGTQLRPHPKVGRNEPCFCGSGRKYKRCHGR